MKGISIYMVVTPDKYELPLYVADTGVEVASWLGISADCVYSTISRKLKGTLKGRKIVKVEIDE